MGNITNYFDSYVINARVKPALFITLPAILTLLVWYPLAWNLSGAIVTVLCAFGVITFVSNWISDTGNILQERLFTEWGGAPTTALLRHSDITLDTHTKQRYHRYLNSKLPDLDFPTPDSEQRLKNDADLIYSSATNYLREATRDTNKYPMVYSDNVAYGYSRNLLAIKKHGMVIAFITFLFNTYILLQFREQFSFDINTIPVKHIFSLGLSIASLSLFLIFLVVINQNYVKSRAVRYAKSLLATCEK